jgi:hypothetical protein
MFKTVAAAAGHNDIIKAGSNLSSSHNSFRKLKRPWPLLYLVQRCGPKDRQEEWIQDRQAEWKQAPGVWGLWIESKVQILLHYLAVRPEQTDLDDWNNHWCI